MPGQSKRASRSTFPSRRRSRVTPAPAIPVASSDLSAGDTAAPRGLLRFLQPIPADRRPRRFGQLLLGLLLYGFSLSMMVRATLGLDPWDVFHQGIAQYLPFSFGVVIILTSVLVLLLWIPLKQRPGIGTLCNAVIVGLATDAGLAILPALNNLGLQITVMLLSVVVNALAGSLYIGAGLGPGARDGLMTGLVRKGVGSVRVVRTGIEGSVLLLGWILGGAVGVGTVLYAFGIGPLLHILMPIFALDRPAPAAVPVAGVRPRRRLGRRRPVAAE